MASNEVVREIAQQLRNRELVIWCGAGISVSAGLPVVGQLVPAILEHAELSTEERDRVEKTVPSRLPFERFMEVILDGMDEIARRDFLALFGAGQPGLPHVFFARLMKRGLLNEIFTTNFDPHLERAVENEGMDRGSDFDVCALPDRFHELQWPPDRPRIVKLHGTAEDPEGLGTTVARIAAPGSVERVIGPTRWAFRDGPHAGVLALGYSFSDRFDLSPAIAGCGRASAKLVWDFQFTQPGDYSFDIASAPRWASDIPHPLASFGDRVRYVYGDWMEVIRRLWELLDLGDSPDALDAGSAWRDSLASAFERLNKKQPGLPRLVLAGQMLTMIGDHKAAVPYLRRAVEIASKGPYETVHLATLQALGGALVQAGDAPAAFTVLHEAEQLATKVDDGRHADHVYALLGMLYQNLGAGYTNAARQYYDRAFGVAKQGDSQLPQVAHLGGLAASWMRIGDFDAAEQAFCKALEIVEASGDLYRTADLCGNMGTMHYILRDYAEALKWYERARATSRLCGDVEREGIHVQNMANLFAKRGEYAKALSLYDEARSLLSMVLALDHPVMQTLAANEGVARRRANPE